MESEQAVPATVSVIGLGKLGLPMTVCIASGGINVIGADLNQSFVDSVNAGKAPIYETDLQEYLDKTSDRISATTDVGEAVRNSDYSFLIVPTPSMTDGRFSLDYIEPACREIGKALREKDDYHLVVITSTVMPLDTETRIKPALEEASGKTCGVDFGLCYSPEFIALGSVIRDFLHPDMILIGESDEHAGDLLEAFYDTVCLKEHPTARMSFVNAELSKLSVNTYVTTKISFANMLARICEALPGGDIDDVTGALGMDTRIGKKYLRGAVGYGGPCFPRDNQALIAMADKIGVPAPLAATTDQFNRDEVGKLAAIVQAHRTEGTVGILGLSYKPHTDVVEQAVGLKLAQSLADAGVPVLAYDPAAMENAKARVSGEVAFADSAQECVTESSVVVVVTPWPQFDEVMENPAIGSKTLIDCWRVYENTAFAKSNDYVAVGRSLVREAVGV